MIPRGRGRQRFERRPVCHVLSRQRFSTSSSTAYTTNRLGSGRVALFQVVGSANPKISFQPCRVPFVWIHQVVGDGISESFQLSLSHYTRVLPLSNLEMVNSAVSDARSWAQSFNRIVELHVETLGRSITEFPSLDCTDRCLPLNSSTSLTPMSRSHKSSTLSAAFPFSKISHCAPLSIPSLSPTSGILLRPRRDSPGPFP